MLVYDDVVGCLVVTWWVGWLCLCCCGRLVGLCLNDWLDYLFDTRVVLVLGYLWVVAVLAGNFGRICWVCECGVDF